MAEYRLLTIGGSKRRGVRSHSEFIALARVLGNKDWGANIKCALYVWCRTVFFNQSRQSTSPKSKPSQGLLLNGRR